MRQTISIIVQGKVQGVFYRQSTKEKALALGLTGIVKNERDGSVQIIATGNTEQLHALAAWCKVGPPRASVNHVQVDIIKDRIFDGFTIER